MNILAKSEYRTAAELFKRQYEHKYLVKPYSLKIKNINDEWILIKED